MYFSALAAILTSQSAGYSMTYPKTQLGDPASLGTARAHAHAAAQLLTKAARANLPAEPGDSHSNLAWENNMFVTQPLTENGATIQIGLSLKPLFLFLLKNNAPIADMQLSGQSLKDADTWLDAQLTQIDLKPASTIITTYDLPAEVVSIDSFASEIGGLGALSKWFSLAAHALAELATSLSDASPSPVRCWPHHFDIATYISLESGDPETAKGIGAGLSPGDGAYDEPDFYVNPWPHLDANMLPDAPAPGHWHTEGFVGCIATGTEILTLEDIATDMRLFLHESVSIGRNLLGN